MTTVSSATEQAGRRLARPYLLAYPAPTTSRFLVLLVALLGSGLFVGDWLHSQVSGPEYVEAYRACVALAQEQVPGPDGPQQVQARAPVQDACRMGTERTRAAFVLGGAVTTGLGGLVVLYAAPLVIGRRRRLRPLTPGLEPARRRFAELATETGLARCPEVLLGSSTQRDAFSFGAPGRYVVVLPPAVAVRWHDPALFDPVVRHELAHVRHRDVTFAWLARSIWYVLAPALALPLVVGVISGDNYLVPDYLWRALVLGLTVQLVAAALLRSREHDADLRAARRCGGPEPVASVVALTRPRPLPWYRRPLATHPDPAQRCAVLEQPDRAAHVSFLDGFAAAFLTALTAPLGVALLIAGTVGVAPPSLAPLLVALVAGGLLGGSVGLALWRGSAIGRVTGRGVSPWPAALGVAAGFVVGDMASLDVTGDGLFGGAHPAWFPVAAVAGVGVTVLVFSVGEVWADVTPALARAWLSWVPAVLVSGLAFALIWWAAQELDVFVGAGGWPAVAAWLVAMPVRWPAIVTLVVLIAVVMFALAKRRDDALAPAWILERGEPQAWPAESTRLGTVAVTAIVAGLVGAATIVVRILVDPASSDAELLQRYFDYIWLAAAVGATTTLVLALLRPRNGPAIGLLVGALAAATTMVGYLLTNIALGAELDAEFVTNSLLAPIVIGLFLAVLVVPATFLAGSGKPQVRRPWMVAAPAALVAGLAVIGATQTTPLFDADTVEGSFSPTAEAEKYLTVVALGIARRYNTLEQAKAAIDKDRFADDPTRAARIRSEIIAPVRVLLDETQSYRPLTPQVERVHTSALAALRAGLESFELFAQAYDTGDVELPKQAVAKRGEGNRHWAEWASRAAKLAE